MYWEDLEPVPLASILPCPHHCLPPYILDLCSSLLPDCLSSAEHLFILDRLLCFLSRYE